MVELYKPPFKMTFTGWFQFLRERKRYIIKLSNYQPMIITIKTKN